MENTVVGSVLSLIIGVPDVQMSIKIRRKQEGEFINEVDQGDFRLVSLSPDKLLSQCLVVKQFNLLVLGTSSDESQLMMIVSASNVLVVASTFASEGGSSVALSESFIYLLILMDLDVFIPGH